MDIADFLIHVHPTLTTEQRTKIEEALSGSKGVVSAHFSPAHLHELTVAYDPEAANAGQLLQIVREWDKAATMVGL
ncbi:MAG: cation transporter [Burkholderiales bacterium]|nr:cation transporter [Burkholderiales bacterium]